MNELSFDIWLDALYLGCMKNDWNISQLQDSDAEAIYKLYSECVNSAIGVDNITKKGQLEAFRSILYEDREASSYKMTDASSKLIGFSSFTWMPMRSPRETFSDLWLSWVGVTEKLRRSGAATELMKHFAKVSLLDEGETYSLGIAENNKPSNAFFSNYNLSDTGVIEVKNDTRFPVFRGFIEDIHL